MEAWKRAVTGDQRKTFFNRKLGRPYIDADQLPVTMAHCMACVEEGKRLGLVWETKGKDCYMGIDQMGSFNVAIIKRRLPDGRQAVVHVEAIFDDNPFARCSELMRAFGVVICVVEQLPNVNDARRFANEFKGRVYLAGYAVTNLGAFAVVAELPAARALADYRGLAQRHPGLAAALVLCLLGLIGTPPTAVFLGKLTVFTAAVDGAMTWLAVLAVINTVASVFYYLR